MPVRFYRTEAGGSRVLEWLRGLDKADRHAIGLDLMRVQFGWPLGGHWCEALKMVFGKYPYRFRANGSPGSSCALTIRCSSCCYGFIKKTRAMPTDDLALANGE